MPLWVYTCIREVYMVGYVCWGEIGTARAAYRRISLNNHESNCVYFYRGVPLFPQKIEEYTLHSSLNFILEPCYVQFYVTIYFKEK